MTELLLWESIFGRFFNGKKHNQSRRNLCMSYIKPECLEPSVLLTPKLPSYYSSRKKDQALDLSILFPLLIYNSSLNQTNEKFQKSKLKFKNYDPLKEKLLVHSKDQSFLNIFRKVDRNRR